MVLAKIRNTQDRIRFDLGIRQLASEWKKLLKPQGLREDLIAGTTVACIAVPLSLAIALASGVKPEVGLVTAIVASIVCALFGGTPLAVSGPAAAMAVLIASVVQDFGLGGLLVVTLGCGIFQILTGVLGFGQVVRFVPVPVIAGFTAGIGAIILIGQLPRALGLPPPDQSHVIDVITHIRDLLHEAKLSTLLLSISTVGITFVLPKFLPRLPAPMIAVLVPSAVVAYFAIQVPIIGNIPNSLPTPSFPEIPSANLLELLTTTFIVYSLASLETLLSSSAVDKLAKGQRHDSDQELIGQGLGNIASSLFGGVPVTGVIARSALNIQAGAKTRRSAIFHGLLLIATVYYLSPWISQIPISVLAGVLLSVALRMLHPREFLQIWHASRSEALIYLVTFFVIVFVDLLVGVQAGVAAALAIAAIRFGQTRTNVHVSTSPGPAIVKLGGPLSFLSSNKLENLRGKLETINPQYGVVLDLSDVKSIDSSGGAQFLELLEEMINKGTKLALKGLSPELKKTLFSLDHHGKIRNHISGSEMELMDALDKTTKPAGLDRLVYGVERFRRELNSGYESLFKNLAKGQSPHTLFITCSDSRINPNLVTSTDPGELFIVRNVGNITPPFGLDSMPAEGAAIEFAIGILGVREIVVCGHSGCGAMKAILSDSFFSAENAKAFPSLVQWLEFARDLRAQLPVDATPEQAAELNAIIQLQHLKTYPNIAKRLASGEIRLHAWYYDIGAGELEEWDESKKMYVTIGSEAARSLKLRIVSGVQFQAPFMVPKKD
jgi:carbonic anhydrase